MLIYIVFIPLISNFLKVDSFFLVFLVGVLFCVNAILPINLGILQGLKKFLSVGLTSLSVAVMKLVLGILLVYLGFEVSGALGAIIISGLLALFVSFLIIRRYFGVPSGNEGIDSRGVLKTSLPMLLPFLLITVLTHVDVILVKHYFPEKVAGLYSVCAVLGRVALYFPGSIIVAMFAMVAHSHSLDEETTPILWKSLLYTFISSGLIIVIYFLIPKFLLSFAFGSKVLDVAPLLGLYSLAMLPMALIRIIANFQMAKGEYSFVYSLLTGTVLMLILISLWHNSLKQVLGILFGVGISLVTYNLLAALLKKSKARR